MVVTGKSVPRVSGTDARLICIGSDEVFPADFLAIRSISSNILEEVVLLMEVTMLDEGGIVVSIMSSSSWNSHLIRVSVSMIISSDMLLLLLTLLLLLKVNVSTLLSLEIGFLVKAFLKRDKDPTSVLLLLNTKDLVVCKILSDLVLLFSGWFRRGLSLLLLVTNVLASCWSALLERSSLTRICEEGLVMMRIVDASEEDDENDKEDEGEDRKDCESDCKRA